MNQRIITIWGSWTSTTPTSILNIYPASQKALEKVKAFVGTMEREFKGMKVEVTYDELEEERGAVNVDSIYKTGGVWKEIKL